MFNSVLCTIYLSNAIQNHPLICQQYVENMYLFKILKYNLLNYFQRTMQNRKNNNLILHSK